MAEETQGQEKTEEPTQRKITKSKEEGQVARSKELNTVTLLLFGSAALFLMGPNLAGGILELARDAFAAAGNVEVDMLHTLGDALQRTLAVAVPLLAFFFVAGLVSSVAVGGFVLSAKAISFKGERMSPMKGFKRMFSAKSLMELAKAIGKFLLISAVAVSVLASFIDELLSLAGFPLESAIDRGLTVVVTSLALSSLALAVIAVIDVPFQMQQFKKQLKMTKQEVKDELKDSEGKPEVKGRIRQIQQEISRRKMLAEVPDADVVITNPEHYAVALKYDLGVSDAPIVVAKGLDLVALKIREIATANGVEEIRVPPLARAVYYATEIGAAVPTGLYIAIAQVLAYVFQLKEFQRGKLESKPMLREIDVPEEYARPL